MFITSPRLASLLLSFFLSFIPSYAVCFSLQFNEKRPLETRMNPIKTNVRSCLGLDFFFLFVHKRTKRNTYTEENAQQTIDEKLFFSSVVENKTLCLIRFRTNSRWICIISSRKINDKFDKIRKKRFFNDFDEPAQCNTR